MQRIMGLGRMWTKLRFCGLEKPEKSYSGLSLLKASKSTYVSKTSEIIEKRLKKQDDIPKDFVLVYRGGMDWYIHASYTISTICLIGGIWSLYIILDSDAPLQFPLHSAWDKLIGIQSYTELLIMYCSFFAMVLAVRGVSRQYVMRMYYREQTKTYRAVRAGYIPSATRTHDFQAGTLHRVRTKNIVPWWNAQYKSNGEKLLILDNGFKTSADFDRMFID